MGIAQLTRQMQLHTHTHNQMLSLLNEFQCWVNYLSKVILACSPLWEARCERFSARSHSSTAVSCCKYPPWTNVGMFYHSNSSSHCGGFPPLPFDTPTTATFTTTTLLLLLLLLLFLWLLPNALLLPLWICVLLLLLLYCIHYYWELLVYYSIWMLLYCYYFYWYFYFYYYTSTTFTAATIEI